MAVMIATNYIFGAADALRFATRIASEANPASGERHIAIAVVDVNGNVVASVGLRGTSSATVRSAESAAKAAMGRARWGIESNQMHLGSTVIQDKPTQYVIGAIAVVGARTTERNHQLVRLLPPGW